ncbi:large neutral amino acids transporter small subunit 2-like protein, partial [Dinothrombium tinctorium]
MHIQDCFTVAKLLVLAVIIATGFYYLFKDSTQNLHHSFEREEGSKFEQLALAVYSGLFAFGGWNYINFVTQELKNPYTNLPIAAITGIILVTLIYVLTNIAYFTVLTSEEILSSPSIAALFARKTLFISWPISIAVAFSSVGGLNGSLFVAARLICMGSAESQLPSVFGMIDMNKATPKPALFTSCFVAIFTLLTSDVFTLINYFSFTVWLWTGISTLGMTYMRYGKPELARPIKIWIGFPILFTLLCLAITLIAILASPLNAAIGLTIVATAFPIFFINRKINRSASDCLIFTRWTQKMFLVATPTDDKNIIEL